jgi:hypothetical protein
MTSIKYYNLNSTNEQIEFQKEKRKVHITEKDGRFHLKVYFFDPGRLHAKDEVTFHLA